MYSSNLAFNIQTAPNKLASQAISVHKFGGSSLATAECVKRVANIIASKAQLQDLVVVSANGDTTDNLLKVISQAKAKSAEFLSSLSQLKQYNIALITDLLSTEHAELVINLLNHDCEQIVQWLNLDAEQHQNAVLAFGELWSARLLAARLSETVCASYPLDARSFLRLDENNEIDYQASQALFQQHLKSNAIAIITGFIALDANGSTQTLGRNGSDYSATIIGSLAKAKAVTFWTDVEGIYSADPRIVPNAKKLHRIEVEVARELGRLGNPVLHARTMKPLAEHQSHLTVASSFNIDASGTEIGHFGQIAQQAVSITAVENALLLESSVLDESTIAQLQQQVELLAVNLAKHQVLIAATQQQAVIQALTSCDAEVVVTPVSAIAAVGFNIAQRSKLRAQFKRAVAHFEPLTVLNSGNQHSIIAAFSQSVNVEMLNHVHHQLNSDAKTIGLVVAGLGNIGRYFIDMLPSQLKRVAALEHVHLVGLLNSKQAWFALDGINVTNALSEFQQQAKPYQTAELLSTLAKHPYDELIVVDITPSEAFSRCYGDFFDHGIHVISANKWAGSSDEYPKLIKRAKENQASWRVNTTVGAGLPVNYAIDDLLTSGDEIQQISGIFSGTLSWLFNQFDGGQPFSQLLLNALEQGITEPDPRDDLSGKDVQRKLLILARAAGFSLKLTDIACENLVPEHLRHVSKEEFLSRCHELDSDFSQRLQAAKQQNNKLCYVAQFEADAANIKATVSLQSVAANHAFANITAGDNIFLIKTKWYQKNPLIIQGPGAGREVTAAGIHSDLAQLCQHLVTKSSPVTIKGIHS